MFHVCARFPILFVILICLHSLSVPALHAEASNRPNVLWICADDHAAYVMGAYGNRQVRTPNLDRLAAGGMRFDRAYCNSAVCTASRQSFLTGKYPRSVGVTLLQTPLPESEVTLAEMLKQAGYETVSIGKMHFNSQLKHGFDSRVDLPDANRWLKQKQATPVDEQIAVLPKWQPFKDPARIWLNGFYRPFKATDADMPGTFFAQSAAEILTRPHEAPLFLMVSFYEPHSPFHFPVEFRDRHRPSEFSAPHPGPEDDPQIPEIFRGLTDAEKQGIIASYYTSVEYLDKNVGVVLDALDRSGQAQSTLVIYTGDHGYMLGQHGRFEKHCSYEEAVRSPLLIRSPGVTRPNTSSEAFVELIDIVPTVLETCKIEIPPSVQGKGLSHLLNRSAQTHREHVVVEYAQNDEIMIRDDRWKLVYERGQRKRTDGYDAGRPLPGPTFRLFDLASDLAEIHNLAKSAKHVETLNRYRDLLVEHLKQTARRPEFVPDSNDPLEILDYCVQPRDGEVEKVKG
jgi:choline-sulfatase